MLGLVNRPDLRPDFGFPGAWLFAEDRDLIHLNFLDAQPDSATGAFNHVAFEAEGFDDLCAALDERGTEYRASIRDEIGLRQVFVKDPNGVRVELNFRMPPAS